jgi:hypothetical protein
MSNSMNDDYFSFMSAKGDKGQVTRPQPVPALLDETLPRSVKPEDVVDYVEEPTIEVTESFVSDTTIQRIFKQFAAPDGATVATPDDETATGRRQ